MEKNYSKSLKITSILMIVVGITDIALGILSVLTAETATVVIWVTAVIALIAGIFEIFAGIKGINNDSSKAKSLIILGAVSVALVVIANVISMVGGGNLSVSAFIAGLIVPIFYVSEAVNLKKRA